MPSLGNTKWGVQFSTVKPNGESTSKSFSGLNLDERTTAEAEAANASTVTLLAQGLTNLTNNRLAAVSLIEARGVNDIG